MMRKGDAFSTYSRRVREAFGFRSGIIALRQHAWYVEQNVGLTMEDANEALEVLENASFQDLDDFEVPPADIVAFTELRSASDLVRMYSDGQLIIDPQFQREVVWSNSEQTRFIDSIVKQLPIPSMCLSLDYKTQTWQVIDGLQRISTIIRFLSDDSWRLSRLEDVNPEISGASVADFARDNPSLWKLRRIVENATLPINVLRCDFSQESHRRYVFEIFHRLNTGGRALSNQEVRNCIYGGPFNDLLNELNGNKEWLHISKLQEPTGKRYRGQEMILRLFAFADNYENYNGRLARFLNDYMDARANMEAEEIEEKRAKFLRLTACIEREMGDAARAKSLALFEAFLVGCWRNLDQLKDTSPGTIRALFDEMAALDEFSSENLSEGLAAREKMIARMRTAEKVLACD